MIYHILISKRKVFGSQPIFEEDTFAFSTESEDVIKKELQHGTKTVIEKIVNKKEE